MVAPRGDPEEGDGSIGLLERDWALTEIDAAVSAAAAGSGRTLLVEGEAGIGKTALLAEAGERAAAAGVTTLRARGRELESEYAFGVVRQLFEGAAASWPADVFAGPARFAAALLGVGADDRGPPAAAESVFPVVHGLYRMTANAVQRNPLALIVDDAQWADGASLRLLAYLSGRIEEWPIVIVAAVRPGERADRLRHMLTSNRPLELDRLSGEATKAIVRSIAPNAGDAAGEACYAATGGNAFYVHEIADALRDGKLSEQALAVDSESPESVVRTIAGRIAALAPGAREAARACVVMGDGASIHSLAMVAGLDDDSAREALDALRAGSILAPGREIEFTHPIVRSAVEASIPPGSLAGAHAGAARMEAAAGASGERVASHLLACDPAGDPWVCEQLTGAARDALAAGAPEAAASYLERALLEPPPAADRPRLLLELGTASAYALRPGATDHVRRGFELADSPEERLDAALLHGHLCMQAGRGGDALEPLFQVLAESPPDSSRALLVEGFAANLTRAQLSGRRAAQPIIDRLRERADIGPDADPPILIAVAAELAMEGVGAERAVALAGAALERLDDVPPLARAFAGLTAVRVLIVADERERAAGVLADAIENARERGALFDFIYYGVSRANLAFRAGRIADSEAEARGVYEIARGERWPLGMASIASYLVQALVERGETGEAWALLAETGLDAPAADLSDVYTANALLLARAGLHLAGGAPDEALADLEELGRRQDAFGEPNPSVSPWRSTMALALLELGDVGRARHVAGEEVELARRWGAPRALGMSLRVAGLLEEGERRAELLGEAVGVLAGSFARLEHGRALADLGAHALASGSRAEARELLLEALELAHTCGAAALEERVMAELRTAGARPRRSVLRGPDALTPSERRVAVKAAEGLSNHEIAEQDFVSVRTVEYHLQGAYRKLGINGRSELGKVLAAGGAERETKAAGG